MTKNDAMNARRVENASRVGVTFIATDIPQFYEEGAFGWGSLLILVDAKVDGGAVGPRRIADHFVVSQEMD